jgi:hypothetical protein
MTTVPTYFEFLLKPTFIFYPLYKVDRMLESAAVDGIGNSIEYWAINTDSQALGRSKALGANVLNIGNAVTAGLGAGGDPVCSFILGQ